MSIIKIVEQNAHELSKHMKANYLKFVKNCKREELLSEYHKIKLIFMMMKHKGRGSIPPFSSKETKHDNIKNIKYKLCILSQELTLRQFKTGYDKREVKRYKNF